MSTETLWVWNRYGFGLCRHVLFSDTTPDEPSTRHAMVVCGPGQWAKFTRADAKPAPPAGKVGDYGEPWQRTDVSVVDKNRKCIIAFPEDNEADRIIACVNELAGLEPERVREALVAANEALVDYRLHGKITKINEDRLSAALSAAEGRG